MSRRAFTSNPLFDRKRRSVGYFGFNAAPLLFLLLPACGLILVILSFIPGLVNIVVMNDVEQRVSDLRGLRPTMGFDREIISEEKWRQRVEENGGAWAKRTLSDDDIRVLSAFDMLDADVNPYDLRVDLEQWLWGVRGGYDAGRAFVVSDGLLLGREEQLVYAHEFTHVLQTQQFGLKECSKLFSESCMAEKSLLEGEAVLVEEIYKDTYFPDSTEEGASPGGTPCLMGALHFPYVQGYKFAETLYAQGGWEAVNAAHANPPRSTEQVLHPDRYLAGDESQTISISLFPSFLGPDWHLASNGILGEYLTRCYLSQQIPMGEAAEAAEGWDGDQYHVFYTDVGELALVLRTVWDTPLDAEEFVAAYAAYAIARPDRTPGDIGDERMCWDGERDHVCLTWRSAETAVVLGPDKETVESLLSTLDLRDSEGSGR